MNNLRAPHFRPNLYRSILAITFMAMMVIIATGCAKKKNDISNVSADAFLSKEELTGCPGGKLDPSCAKTYSAAKTIVSADENLDATGVVPGFHADMGFVQFVVTEKELQVRRVGEPNRTPETATVVASFPILSHFDIIREKNDFGEETNKIIEDQKKPWNERTNMRVDLGSNKVASTSLSNIFSSTIKEEGAQVVSSLKKEGDLLSFDVDATITETDRLDDGGGQDFESVAGGLRAKIKNSFLEVKKSDYVPYEMPNKEFARFGYFRTYENFVNPDKGVTVSGRKLLANRFNVCESNEKTVGLSCSRNKITYVLSKDFPEEYRQPARDVIASWNKSFQKALDRTDDIVVLDESVQPEIGDSRYAMIAAINEKVPTFLLGVSQTLNNPSTGETLAARASVYMGTVSLLGGMAAEQLDLIVKQALEDLNAGKLDKEISASTGPKLLLQKQKIRDQLNLGKLAVKPQFVRPKGSALESLKKQASIPAGIVATQRKNDVFTKLPQVYDIADTAWNKAGDSKMENLKQSIMLGKSEKTGKTRKDQKYKDLAMAEKGIHQSDFVEPAVELYILKFIAAHQGEPIDKIREQLKVEVRRLVFFSTLIHEMGHNFGLRHNFASSGDRKNYSDKYYELEKQKQAMNPSDPKFAQLELEQESYDFSSVMDYAGGFNEVIGGTGHYDDAAIRYAYNTSISKDGDPITGIVHDYKFCTDHEVGEDLMCQRFDKGSNVTQTTTKIIEDYGRNYYFRNFRRDRADFGDAGSYFNRVLTRTMLPIRQVADELVYQIIVSPTVAASDAQCDSKFFRDSIDSGEIGNLCDPAVLQKYAQAGLAIQDWSQIVYLLLKEDLSGFRKDPKTYKANGFADLIFANYHASNFFVSVLGTPEPGQYYPMADASGSAVLEALPAGQNDDQRLLAYLATKGVTGDQAAVLIPKIRGNIVDLKPGPQAKFLQSQMSNDGSFKQTEVMGHLYDKLAAIVIMGARGLPVEKYWEASFSPNLFFLPQSKATASALMNALVNENKLIATSTVTTKSGAQVDASVPASLNLNTKYYGIITSLTDFISDQNQEFSDKMRICSANEQGCQNNLNKGVASFKGANGQNVYRAAQVPSGDSVVFALVNKGQELSKLRDTAEKDIKDKATLVTKAKTVATGAPAKQKALMTLLTTKAPDLAKKLNSVYGDSEQTLWGILMAAAKDPESADSGQAQDLKNSLPNIQTQVQDMVKKDLASNDALLKEVQAALKPVDKDLSDVQDLTYRVVVSPLISAKITDDLAPIEADAKNIRYFRSVLVID